MTARVAILTGNHLCHNPRVIKEATTLARAGYEVAVLGAWFDSALKDRDQKLQRTLPFEFIPVIDATNNSISRIAARLRGKIASIVHRVGHKENRWQLGYAYPALRRAAFGRGADLYIAHSEAAMAVATDLLENGRRVALDMEDWFSEDLLPEARRNRPLHLLRFFEAGLLTRGAYVSCPSRSMSEALAKEFNCEAPVVVGNAFAWSDRESIDGLAKDRQNRTVPSIHWVSQTLGAGRGLEDLVAALPLVDHPAEIHLRGVPAAGFEAWLWQNVPETWRNRISIHPLVANDELLSRIAEHDIGFAGESKRIRARDLTSTNKTFQYLLAGLAVVASDTAGQREVAEQAPGAMLIYPSGDPVALAARLNSLLASPENLRRAKGSALRAAEMVVSWERQEEVLLSTITRALRVA